MSIATEISRLQTAKSDIKTAIEAKGVTVPSSATIDTYDDYVSQISGGGSPADLSVTYKNSTLIESGATDVVIGNNITSIGNSAFQGWTSLSSVTMSDSVRSIGNSAFQGCTSLTSFIIPNSVTSIGNHAFHNCRSLSSITLSNNLTSIGTNAFSGCTSLTDIVIPDSVTSTLSENAFKYCTHLTGVTIGSGLTTIGTAAFSRIGATELNFPDTLTTIGRYACDWSTSLTSVTIGSGCTSILEKAFDHCTSLSSVTITATTPPTLGTTPFSNTSSSLVIYVPASALSDYQAASGWSSLTIQAIPSS